MGQYYYAVNVDKKQFVHPHKLGDGLKLMEIACSANGTMAALAVLLADGNGRGGGDLRDPDDPYGLVGSWAGDRIVMAGDYADANLFGCGPDDDPPRDSRGELKNLYTLADETFCDISEPVRAVLCSDKYLSGAMERSWAGTCDPFDPGHPHAPGRAAE